MQIKKYQKSQKAGTGKSDMDPKPMTVAGSADLWGYGSSSTN